MKFETLIIFQFIMRLFLAILLIGLAAAGEKKPQKDRSRVSDAFLNHVFYYPQKEEIQSSQKPKVRQKQRRTTSFRGDG